MSYDTPPQAAESPRWLPDSCTTPGCQGDARYAAPGRGHIGINVTAELNTRRAQLEEAAP